MERLRIVITKHKTLLLYLVAGGLTTLVNYLVYFLVRYWQGEAFDILALLTEKSDDTAGFTVAHSAGVVCSVVFAYFVNKLMVFQTKHGNTRAVLREALAFFTSRAVTVLFEISAGVFLVSMLSFPEFATKLVLNVFVILLNYLLSVTIVFRKKEKSVEEE
ncbi:MAG: GtrA family protein [Oscillospiraceae bacterium]|jgi:putative flippase GtrA|nr:GtrA family protein [Oscillospiraceae bacterium]